MPIVKNSKHPEYTPENLFVTESKNTVESSNYFSKDSAIIKRAINENFDISDSNTRKALLSMTEAEHNSILTKLTSKLYDHIVKKTTDIDFGKIPDTKGDITKLEQYEDLKEVMSIMKNILKEYRESTGPIDTLTTALANIETRRDLFERGFRYNSELPMLMYNTITLSIVNGVSYLIAACIEFIKAPRDESFQISLDKVAYAKTKDHILYQSLDKFNKACEKGDFDKAMGVVIDQHIRKFTGVALGILVGTAVGITIILNIVPILRELVYVLYYSRMKVADFFEIQADLLQMNAYNVEHNNSIDKETKKEIVEKQLSIADRFRKISNVAQIDSKKTDVEASKELQSANKKYKIDELGDKVEDSTDNGPDSTSALF